MGMLQYFKLNNFRALSPSTSACAGVFQPRTFRMANKLSSTLCHFWLPSSGGKNGWSVPKSILVLPRFVLYEPPVEL